MIYRNCPICGEKREISILEEFHMALISNIKLPKDMKIVSCDRCGFCYADTEANIEDYDEYYAESSNSFTAGIMAKDESCVKFNQDILSFLRLFADKESHILDVGCGYGRFLDVLKEAGYKHLYGIDPSETNVHLCQSKGIDAKVGNIYDEVQLEQKNKFDVCFLSSVLEHLLYPGGGVKNLCDFLKPQGILVISVPDIGRILEMQKPKSYFFHHEHINYFSRESLNNLMALFGLKEVNSISVSQEASDYLLWAAYTPSRGSSLIKDEFLAKKIKQYLYRENIYVENRFKQFRKGERIIIYGMGVYAMSLLTNRIVEQWNIVMIVDGNPQKQGKYININNNDYRIMPPQALKDVKEAQIIVCVNMDAYAKQIIENIKHINKELEIIRW